jgi:hypothetical protein
MSSLETLNSKLVVNELSFPLVTQMTYSNERFDSYGILNSGHGDEDLRYDDGARWHNTSRGPRNWRQRMAHAEVGERRHAEQGRRWPTGF